MAGQAKTGANKTKVPVRMLNGKVVTTVLYNGKNVGHGKYFAGMVENNLVCDESGKPLPLNMVGEMMIS